MLGLAYIFVFIIYLAISFYVVRYSVKAARKRNIKSWKFGVPAALFMYLIVFWDHIPTLILHKYYCATETGFWVYKSPDQWLDETGVSVNEIVPVESLPRYRLENGGTGYHLNSRFSEEIWPIKRLFLPITVRQAVILDKKTNAVMVKSVTVSSGYGGLGSGGISGLKAWVGSDTCYSKRARELGKYNKLFRDIGDKK